MSRSITVKTPASAGNVGPGHDCFGLAFGLYNEFTFRIPGNGEGFQASIKGRDFCLEQDLTGIPRDHKNVALQSFLKACETFKLTSPHDLHVDMILGIPLDRGLGSSATARVAGVLAARALLDSEKRIPDTAVESLCAALEGHPDNALPCLHGGFVMTIPGDIQDKSIPVELPNPPAIALIIPKSLVISTNLARKAIPKTIPLQDAIYSNARGALLAVALATGQHHLLGEPLELIDDRLHEPYRGPLIPEFARVRALAQEAGAYGLVISGSGPTLLVLAKNNELAQNAGKAVQDHWKNNGIAAWISSPGIATTGALTNILERD
jgi:homoserine kinase